MACPMRRIGYLGIGLVFLATGASAVDRRPGAGTLAREATPGRLARLAEIAKDATPPKPGGKRREDSRPSNTGQVRIPIGR